MPLHVSSTCAHYQEVKIALHSLWYHHTYRCDDTRGCVMHHTYKYDDTRGCVMHHTYGCDDTRGCVMHHTYRYLIPEAV
jgi:hypothetical protein